MGDDENRTNKALLVSLARAMQRLRATLEPVVRRGGLTASQWDVLAVLQVRGPQSVNDLINRCITSSGNIDVVIRNLMAKKLIMKQTDPKDARRRLIELTPAGEQAVKISMPAHEEAHRRLFGALTPKEKRQLRTLLKKITMQEENK